MNGTPSIKAVLESHDPGEEPHPGGELYLRYGKGVYVFSAFSWFRELPAGVPGAFRFFANMLSAGKTFSERQCQQEYRPIRSMRTAAVSGHLAASLHYRL